MAENIKVIGNSCVGCRSCEQVCPVSCIDIRANQEGFLYPVVDENKCISCGKCMRCCPVNNKELHRFQPQNVYALKNKDEVTIMNSASGGAGDLFATAILKKGGVVFGAAYDEKLHVHHIQVDKIEDKAPLQSSKYVQSDTEHTYLRVKELLANGKEVLFTGTPCQIAGLYSFLGGDQPGLFTVDLICHGVPSPKFFEKYIGDWNKRMDGKVIYYNFRSKEKRGWGTQYLLKTKTKTKTKTLSLDKYGQHFMAADCYRECCYECLYANTNRVGDVTVGDFWGISKSHPKFFSSKGVSSVFVNTEKGTRLLEAIKANTYIETATLSEAMVKQGNLVKPATRPSSRNYFYNHLEDKNFITNMRVGIRVQDRIKALIPSVVIRELKKLS